MTYSRKEKYSIRKTNLGAVSARIAVIGLVSLLGASQDVQADTLDMGVTAIVQPEGRDETEDNVVETIDIASPVTYVADETKEIGYHEVEAQGQAGQLIISETDGVTSAERIEPTVGREVFGTKPKVEEVILERATTEYVANDELDAGTQVVKQEGVDGKEVTRTSYRIDVQELIKKDLKDKVGQTNKIQSDRPDYQGVTPYTIDWSQDLPSDQIVIDEAAIKAEVVEWLVQGDWIGRIRGMGFDYDITLTLASGERTKYLPIELPNSELEGRLEQYFVANTPSEAKYADVKAAYLHFQTLVNHIRETYQGDDLLDFIKTSGLFSWSWGQSYAKVGPEGEVRPDLVHRVVNGYNPTDTALLRRYLAELDKAGVIYQVVADDAIEVDGVVYPIKIQSSFADFVAEKYTADDWTNEEILQKFEDWVATYEAAFENQTKRYNNNQGRAQELNIIYKTQQMPEEERIWFEEQVAKLPEAIKRIFLQLVIQDEVVASSETARGIAWKETDQIQLRYPMTGSKEDLLRIFLHELSHVIDDNAWQFGSNFSNSMEFTELYNQLFNRPITQENPAVKPYYQDHIFESFAEFFGNYLLHRIYGYDYVKFIEVDGEILTLRTYGDYLDNDEDAAKGRELTEKYYNDPRAYSPVAEAEWFFDKLYALLFEQETQAEVVVDTIKTEVIDVQQKIVEVGTKPEVVEQITAYTTIEREDAELLIGEKKVIQIGKSGIVRETTTYELVDKTTGEIVATTTSQVVQELVEEIVAVGTKVIEVLDPADEEPAEEIVEAPTEEIETPTEPPVSEEISESETDTPTPEEQVEEEVTAIPDEAPVEDEKPKAEILTEVLDFVTRYVYDDNLAAGQVIVDSEGQKGHRTYARTADGDFDLELVPALDRVIRIGRKDNVEEKKQTSESTQKQESDSEPVVQVLGKPQQTPQPTYSRVACANAEKGLPETGEAGAIFSLLGVGMTGLGLLGRRRGR